MKSATKVVLACILVAVFATSCNMSRFPIDEPATVKIDSRLIGKWKVKSSRKVRIDISRENDFQYHVNVIESGKKTDEHYTAFLSVIQDNMFINIGNTKEDSSRAYLFLRILSVDANAGKIQVATVSDSTMQYLQNATQVRDRITQNLNNRSFYSDTTWLIRKK